MRTLFSIGFVVALTLGTAGCTNNVKKTEDLTEQIIAEMNKMSDAIEKGDKPAREAAMAKMRSIAQEGKNLKITAEQNKAMEAKYKPKFDEVTKRMEKSFTTALASGKMTPEELKQFGEDMIKLGEEMKAMGK